MGQIKTRNSNPSIKMIDKLDKMWRTTVNFMVYNKCDQTTATHILDLNNFNTDIVTTLEGNSSVTVGNGLDSDHSWVLLLATP